MFQNSDNYFGRRFLKEALPLVSTYFSGESVELTGMITSVGDEPDSEILNFVEYIRFRHAIACCLELFPIVKRIEERISTFSDIERKETEGIIRGRLDIPRYVAQRSLVLSWPRTYPLLMTTTTLDTPENSLVIGIFRTLLSRLSIKTLPINSAELLLAQRSRQWIINRIKREPWLEVSGKSSLHRLYLEASRRVDRQQTGNVRAYFDLIKFVKDWRLIGGDFTGVGSSDRFVDSMLAFPANQSFFDRIYEVWCICEVAKALTYLGANLLSGPIALADSRKKPVFTFDYESNRIEVWFQRPLPSAQAEWGYDSTGAALRGIPDISVIANESHFILIDAKNKLVTTTTRSEETYKMLGYFENFNSVLKHQTCWGVLAFMSFDAFSRSLKSKNGRHLDLISAHPIDFDNCTFSHDISLIIKQWIMNWKI